MKATEMLACMERELAKRKIVYPQLVASGRMRKSEMDMELRAAEAILEHFRELSEAEMPGLPGMGKRNVSCPACGCKMLV